MHLYFHVSGVKLTAVILRALFLLLERSAFQDWTVAVYSWPNLVQLLNHI